MAKATGADRNIIAALSQAIFAIAIEFASGVGFWVVFGHAGPRPREEVHPPSSSIELVPVDPRQKLIPIADPTLLPARQPAGRRVRDADFDAAIGALQLENLEHYKRPDAIVECWAHHLEEKPFDDVGGLLVAVVWYLNCELAER